MVTQHFQSLLKIIKRNFKDFFKAKQNPMSFRTCFGIAIFFRINHATLKRVQGDFEAYF